MVLAQEIDSTCKLSGGVVFCLALVLFFVFFFGCCLHVLFDCFAKAALNTLFGLTLQLCLQLSKQAIKQISQSTLKN